MTPEDTECKMFAQWLRIKKLRFTHISNETGFSMKDPKATMYVVVKKKSLGMSEGFPDYEIFIPKGTLYIEMKDPKKKLKKGNVMEDWKDGQKERGGLKRAQKEWIEYLQGRDHTESSVCYGAEEAIAFVEIFL